MFYYLNLFLTSSVLGFILETTLKLLVFPSMNNGIMFGPWIPIYGFGVVIITIISKTIFRNLTSSRKIKLFLTFLTVTIVLTFLEWLGGISIELIFNKTFWDYSDLKFNIGKYIAIEMSLIWGVASIIFIYIIKPIEDKIIKKIPKYLTIIVLGIFIVDLIFTFLSV